MPLTEKGKKMMAELVAEHGEKEGPAMFYKLINSGKVSKSKVEGKGHSRGKIPRAKPTRVHAESQGEEE